MKMQEVRKLAKKYNINSFGKSKINLIQEIQRAEGNFDCFGKSNGYCNQYACCFRSSCLDGHKTKHKKTSSPTQSAGYNSYYNANYLLAGMHSMKSYF